MFCYLLTVFLGLLLKSRTVIGIVLSNRLRWIHRGNMKSAIWKPNTGKQKHPQKHPRFTVSWPLCCSNKMDRNLSVCLSKIAELLSGIHYHFLIPPIIVLVARWIVCLLFCRFAAIAGALDKQTLNSLTQWLLVLSCLTTAFKPCFEINLSTVLSPSWEIQAKLV